MAWEGSNRRARLPPNWRATRARILARDILCAICRAAPSTQIDHITPGDNHADTNLQGLCAPCHTRKSATEGVAAQRRRQHPPEPHPGTH